MRKITLITSLFLLGALGINAQRLSATKDKEGIQIKERNQSVLYYQLAPKDMEGAYQRANYIHPLYGIDGSVLSEDFPDDHLHHRGIFWAWHQLYVGNVSVGDPWECKGVTWEVVSDEVLEARRRKITLQTRTNIVSHVYPNAVSNTPVLSETVTVEVHTQKRNYRIIDITLALRALVSDVTLGGSDNEKGYGGFSARIKMPEDLTFSSVSGEVTPQTNAVSAGHWMNMAGSLSDDGSKAGLVIVASQENPDPINEWILRSRNSMQNPAWPGQYRIPLSESEDLVLKYRLIVYDDHLSNGRINKLANHF